jgi:hypothetical protein
LKKLQAQKKIAAKRFFLQEAHRNGWPMASSYGNAIF